MTSMLPFDTLAYAKRLKSAGFPDAQAEALAEAESDVFQRMLETTLATKDDLKNLATKDDLQALRADLKGFASKDDLQALRADLKGFATKDDLQFLRADLRGFATKDDLQAQLQVCVTKADLVRVYALIATQTVVLVGAIIGAAAYF